MQTQTNTPNNTYENHYVHDHGHHNHPHYLAHHFKTMDQQTSSGKMGMWLFMAQEMMFFMALFGGFFYMRFMYPEDVTAAQMSMSVPLGILNSVILLFSSLTISLCVYYTRLHKYGLAKFFILVTMLCGAVFLSIKGFEWYHHIHEGLLPGRYYHPEDPFYKNILMAPMFFGLYYVMTGMHGLHIIIGLGLMTWMYRRIAKQEFNFEHYVALENVSLFWHLVDIVWIFLFPIMYLIH
jgi:cytochrome c oxidase subunit III